MPRRLPRQLARGPMYRSPRRTGVFLAGACFLLAVAAAILLVRWPSQGGADVFPTVPRGGSAERALPPGEAGAPEVVEQTASATAGADSRRPEEAAAAAGAPGAAIRGVVRPREGDATIGGALVTAVARPVAGLRLGRVPVQPIGPARPALSTRSEEDGSFVLPVRAGVLYELSAEHDGLVSGRYADVAAGEFVEVRLAAWHLLSGTLRTPAGDPGVSRGRVLLQASADGGWRRYGESLVAEEDGRFEARVPEGRYRLQGWSDRWLPSEWTEVDLVSRASVDVSLRLQKGCVVRGVVTGEGGLPVAGADVSLGAAPGQHTVCDRAGRFELAAPCGTGGILGAVAEGYARAEVAYGEEDVLAAGAPPGEPVEITLRRGAAVRMHVVRSDDHPAAGASVFLLAEGNLSAARGRAEGGRGDGAPDASGVTPASFRSEDALATRCDDDGLAALQGVRTDIEASVLVTTPEGESRFVWLPPLVEGETRDLGTIRTIPDASLTGLVVDGEGSPLPHVDVQVNVVPVDLDTLVEHPHGLAGYSGGLGREWTVPTDEHGRFLALQLLAGRFELVVQSTEPRYGLEEGLLSAGRRTDLGRIEPERSHGRGITGRVLFHGERPAGSITVHCTAPEAWAEVALGEDDRFALEVQAEAADALEFSLQFGSAGTFGMLACESAGTADGDYELSVFESGYAEITFGQEWEGHRVRVDARSSGEEPYHQIGLLNVTAGRIRPFLSGEQEVRARLFGPDVLDEPPLEVTLRPGASARFDARGR